MVCSYKTKIVHQNFGSDISSKGSVSNNSEFLVNTGDVNKKNENSMFH